MISEIANSQFAIPTAIKQASAAYDWETVCELATEALQTNDLSPVEEFDLRQARAEANQYLANFAFAVADLKEMVTQAKSMGNDVYLARTLNQLAGVYRELGDGKQAQATGEEALRRARDIGDKGLEAAVLNTLGYCASEVFDRERAEILYNQALAAARDGSDKTTEAIALARLGNIYVYRFDYNLADTCHQEALNKARALGNRRVLVEVLNTMGTTSRDMARRRDYFRLALKQVQTIKWRTRMITLDNNLAMLYWRLGLYNRALTLAQNAVRVSREHGQLSYHLLFYLDTLILVAAAANRWDIVQRRYPEIVDLVQTTGERHWLADAKQWQGQLAFEAGQIEDAIAAFREAVSLAEPGPMDESSILALCSLVVCHLARGERAFALEASKKALDLAAGIGLASSDIMPQDVWWRRYQALISGEGETANDEAWQVLEQARQQMFAAVDNIGDEGLRRNYLNKPQINRAISETWAKEAAARGLSLAPYTEREIPPAALAEQLQRIVESGARLAAERDTHKLTEFVLQEFVELSGVERAVVALRVGAHRDAPLTWVALEGIDEIDKPAVAAFISPFMNQAAETRAPLLVDSVGASPEDGVPELHLRSLLALPLLSQGKLLGVLYGDMRHLFGRLNDNDRDILSLLANQATAALENANWVATLEQQVADRTAELQASYDNIAQRNAELAVINSVQSGLAAQLDMQAVYDLVGDTLQGIFSAQSVSIGTFDTETELVTYMYVIEEGRRLPLQDAPFGPGARYLVKEKKALHLRNPAEIDAFYPEIVGMVGEELTTRSWLMVPLIAGESALGVIMLEDERPDVFNDADERLLTTLANSMSVALENARLFNETQQGAREISALSEVGSDISSTLDLTEVLERIAGHALTLLDVSDSALFLLDESGRTMRGFVALGEVAEQMKAVTVQKGQGILGDIWQTRTAEVINNPLDDPRGETVAGTETAADERLMVAPLLSAEDVTGLMAVWRDGERFKETDLQFLNGLARQAAIAIQNAQLYSDAEAAMADAERANEAKSTFLANMSHELRTPLNAIIGFTRIVKRKATGQLPEKQVENLGKVLDSAQHLLGLINTVLDIAKIEAGRMDVSTGTFAVEPLIAASIATSQPLLKPNVVLQQQIDPELPPVTTDMDKLKQILINLLSNAAKFTHEGSITMRARQEGEMLEIDVVDTGIGISEEALGRIFEEFQQADSSTTRQYGGTGLGLPISKHLAQLLGGDLTAESVAGQGSTFTATVLMDLEKKDTESTEKTRRTRSN